MNLLLEINPAIDRPTILTLDKHTGNTTAMNVQIMLMVIGMMDEASREELLTEIFEQELQHRMKTEELSPREVENLIRQTLDEMDPMDGLDLNEE